MENNTGSPTQPKQGEGQGAARDGEGDSSRSQEEEEEEQNSLGKGQDGTGCDEGEVMGGDGQSALLVVGPEREGEVRSLQDSSKVLVPLEQVSVYLPPYNASPQLQPMILKYTFSKYHIFIFTDDLCSREPKGCLSRCKFSTRV